MTATGSRATRAEALIDAARALAPEIHARRDEIEQQRRLPLALVEAMREAGLFRAWLPAALGGYEIDPCSFVRIMEEVAKADGAAGWNLMIGAGTNFFAAFLREDVALEMFGTDGRLISGGTLSPQGRATLVAGGYRVSGRWPFGSGSQHCNWLLGNCIVMDGDKPLQSERGAPEIRITFFPASDTELIDTWQVAGLRGSGSLDYAVSDLFVPADRTFLLGKDKPFQPAPLFAIPQGGLFACAIASVALGIARGAIEALVELAGAKIPTMTTTLLRERTAVQAAVARAEALLRSARAFVFEVLAEAWEVVNAGDEVSLMQRAVMRSAATHALVSCAEVVDLMYNAGGASSIYTSSPLERAFRDIHVATQHAMVSPVTFETAGKIFLGMDPGPGRF